MEKSLDDDVIELVNRMNNAKLSDWDSNTMEPYNNEIACYEGTGEEDLDPNDLGIPVEDIDIFKDV